MKKSSTTPNVREGELERDMQGELKEVELGGYAYFI